MVNKAKSYVFLGKYSRHRAIDIQHILGIKEGNVPFNYLGVPIFFGRPKTTYFRSIPDKTCCKLIKRLEGFAIITSGVSATYFFSDSEFVDLQLSSLLLTASIT